MKKKLMSNWGLKLISIVFAMILWLVVVNVDDPVTTKKFKDIPVKILNEELLSEAGEVYEVLDNSDKVTITVKAKRSVVEALRVEDFRATADFAERIAENSIPITVSPNKYASEIVDIYLQNNTVKINVEKKAHKEIPVEIEQTGKTAEGYAVGKVEVSPETVSIAGPYSVISKVSKVVVPLDVKGASEDLMLVQKGKFCDDRRNVIKDSRIEGDIDSITVSVHMLHTKSVDLNLSTEGEPAADYRCQDIQYTPTTITIAGEQQDLEQINTLQIPSYELNIEGATQNIEKEIDVTQYLPENLIICNEEERKIHVTLVISQLDGREFNIPISEVDVLNTPSGMDTILDFSRTVNVIVKGTTEDLSKLSRSDIKVSIDLKGKAIGTYNLQADVIVPAGYVVMNKPMVSVSLVQTDNPSYENGATEEPSHSVGSVTQTTPPQNDPVPVITPTIPPATERPVLPTATPMPTEEPPDDVDT